MEEYKTGLRIRYEKSVDPEIKVLYTEFAKWLRREYCFPLRINVYIKSSYKIKAMDGESVVGTFFWPGEYVKSPYIRLATGDYYELMDNYGEYQAKGELIISFAHELTHYDKTIKKIQHIILILMGQLYRKNNITD